MADGSTEPPLPPAYQAVHAAHQRLADATRHHRWRSSVDAAIADEEERLRPLWQQLQEERADVEALEGRTLRSMRSRLRRSLDDDLVAEQADVRTVEAEIALRLAAIDAIDASPGRSTIEGAARAIDQARRDLHEAMAWWRNEHIAARSPLGIRLVELDHLAAYLHALRRELHEALDVARLATAALVTARRAVSSRSLTSILGRGDPAQAEAIANVQRWLLELRAELADLREVEPPRVDGPEITLPGLHIGPGDVFDDWIVDNRVVASTTTIDATLIRVGRVATGLAEFVTRLDALIDAVQRQGWDLLLQHPGVIQMGPPTSHE